MNLYSIISKSSFDTVDPLRRTGWGEVGGNTSYQVFREAVDMEIHRLLLKVTEPCLFVLGVHDRIKCASAFHVAVSPVCVPFSALRV